jgi:hypothetical protein
MLTKHENRITSAEMRYLGKCMGKTRRDRIRNSQIRGILNQEPVTKMVDRRELRWFRHLIRINSNRKPRQVLSSSGNLISVSAGVKRQAGQVGSTMHASPTFFSPFQRHCLITSRTLQFRLSNGMNFLTK